MQAFRVVATILGALGAGIGTYAALYNQRKLRGVAGVSMSIVWITSAAFVGAFAAFTATTAATQSLATDPGGPVPETPEPTATASTMFAKIGITWDEVEDAEVYQVRRQESGDDEWVVLIDDLLYGEWDDNDVSHGTTYGYQVRACNGPRCSPWSAITSALTMPATPSPTATASTTEAAISIDWADLTGVDAYEIQRQVSGGGFSTFVTDLEESEYDDDSVAHGTTYGYKVRACNATACSEWSSTTSALTLPAVPDAPSLTPEYRKVTVTWSSVTGATKYDLQRNVDGGSYSDLASNVSSPYANTPLSDNTTYGYKVRACNATACSAYSSAQTATTAPAIPTFDANVSGITAELTWNAPAGATNYKVQVSTTDSAPDRADDFDRSDSATSLGTLSDTLGAWSAASGTWGIADDQAYLATNSGGNNYALIDTGSPDGYVQFTLGASAVNSQGAVFRFHDANNFMYLWAAPGFASWGVQKVVNGVNTQIANTGLSPLEAGLVVRVEYEGANIRVYFNGQLAADITDAANSGYTLAGLYGGSATNNTARWDDFSAGQLPGVTSPITGITDTTYIDTNLRAGTRYLYTVAACNAEGTCSSWTTPDGGYSYQPAPALILAAPSSTQVAVLWSTAGLSGGTRYAEWGWRPKGGSWTDTLATGYVASQSGLTANTTYEFRVRSCAFHVVNICANPSAWTSKFITTPPTAAPSAPTGVTAVGGYGAAAVSWTAPSGSVTEYRVHAYVAGIEMPGSPKSTGSAQTTYMYTGLIPALEYTFKVEAVNSAGTSSLSDASTAVMISSNSQRLAPDGILDYANLDNPTVTPIQDDPDDYLAPDNTSLNGVSTTAHTDLRVSFPTPSGTLYGQQTFNVFVKKRNNPGASTNAIIVLRLYENGSLVSSSANRTVTSTASSGLYSYTWDAATVTNPANVELMIDQTGNNNVTIDIYAVEWNAKTVHDFDAPNAPTNVTASVSGLSGEATVSWTAPAAVAAPVSNYRVTVYSGTGGSPVGVIDWTTLTREVGSTTTSYTFNGLRPGKSYTFKVEAYNAGGWGTASSASNSVTANV